MGPRDRRGERGCGRRSPACAPITVSPALPVLGVRDERLRPVEEAGDLLLGQAAVLARALAVRNRGGKRAYWLPLKQYAVDAFEEQWQRIGQPLSP